MTNTACDPDRQRWSSAGYFCMLFFSELFAITAVTGKCAMLMIVFAVITEPVFRYLIQLVETVQKWGGKLKF